MLQLKVDNGNSGKYDHDLNLDVDFVSSELRELQPRAVLQYVEAAVLYPEVSDLGARLVVVLCYHIICFVVLFNPQIT